MKVTRSVSTAILTLFVLFTLCEASRSELTIGDGRAAVEAALGKPRGSITSGPYQLLQFTRGRVELHDGLVTRLDIVSEAVAQRQRIQREQAAEARRIADAEQHALRYAEGVDVRERAANDPNFEELSGQEQLNFWNHFRGRFPGVSIGVEYAAAASSARRDGEQRRENERLARMEQRIVDAEAKARNAERQADRLAEDLDRRRRRTTVTYLRPYCEPLYPRPIYKRVPVKKISYVSKAKYAPHIKRSILGYGDKQQDEESPPYAYVTDQYPTFSQYHGTSHSRVSVRY